MFRKSRVRARSRKVIFKENRIKARGRKVLFGKLGLGPTVMLGKSEVRAWGMKLCLGSCQKSNF